MKKKLTFILILFLTLINTKSLLHSGFPYTHDGENHLARFANYKTAIREGQFPPRFAPNLVNHYGYPVLNYNYPLANILSLPFSLLKINYQTTFKIITMGFVFAGLYGVNFWLRKLKIKYSARWIGLVIYGLSPYLISSIIYRGNIGEVMAYCLFPWLLWIVEKNKEKRIKNKDLFIVICLLTAFMLSHNVSVMFGLPLMVIYALIRFGKDIKSWKFFGFSLLTSGFLSLWFWLPAVMEKSLIVLDGADLSNDFALQFPTLDQLLFAPVEFGFSYPGSIDSLSFSIGMVGVLTFVISTVMMLRIKIKEERIKLFYLIYLLFFFLFFFQLSITIPIWQALPLVRYIQFPWRLSLFIFPFLAFLASMVWSEIGDKLKKVLMLLIFIQVIIFLRLKPIDYFNKTNIDYDAFSQSTTTSNENTPKSFTYSDIADWQPTATIINGDGEVSITYWKGSDRRYQLNLDEESTIVEPTMYFAGWQTVVNGRKIDYLDNEQIGGRIGYRLPAGNYLVRSSFTQWTWPRIVGNSVSIVTGLGLVVWLLFRKK